MLNSKSLVEMARKWRKAAALGSTGSSTSSERGTPRSGGGGRGSIAGKGHFVVYTSEGRQFELPLACLDSSIFRELQRQSEDEFGPPRDGPIMLACDAGFLDYILRLFNREVPEDVERALLLSIVSGRCTTSFLLPERPCGRRQLPVLWVLT